MCIGKCVKGLLVGRGVVGGWLSYSIVYLYNCYADANLFLHKFLLFTQYYFLNVII